jgi:hypothetical protein
VALSFYPWKIQRIAARMKTPREFRSPAPIRPDATLGQQTPAVGQCLVSFAGVILTFEKV